MIDREKVIKGLECCAHEAIGDCNNCPYNENTPHCDIAMMRDAIELLRAQEPVEPLRINHDTKWQRDTECICGECGGSFYRLKVNFCPWCGKAVKWE